MSVSGDLYQLLPVMENASPAKVINYTLKHSSLLWDEHVVTLRLQENMTAKNIINNLRNDKEYHTQFKGYEHWLLKPGESRLPSAKTEEQIYPDTDVIEIPHDMFRESKEEVIEEIFKNFKANVGMSEYFLSKVLLAAKNQIINEVNNEMVDTMPGNLHCFSSVDTVYYLDDTTMFPT